MSKVSKTNSKNLMFVVSESGSQTPEGMDVNSAFLWNPCLHHTWRVGVISSAAVDNVPVWGPAGESPRSRCRVCSTPGQLGWGQ